MSTVPTSLASPIDHSISQPATGCVFDRVAHRPTIGSRRSTLTRSCCLGLCAARPHRTMPG